MVDYLAQLRKIIPPPTMPIEAYGDWSAAESELGSTLPEDYKQFVVEYGRGRLFNLLWIFTPFPKDPRSGLKNAVDEILAGYRIVLKSHPDLIPFALFPESGGILPFVQSDNADELHWVRSGEPNEWHILVTNLSALELYEYKGYPFVKFICAIATGEIVCPAFPRKFIESKRFEPFDVRDPEKGSP